MVGSGMRSTGHRVVRAIAAIVATVALVGGGVAVTSVTSVNSAAAASARLPGWLHTSGASIKTSKSATYVIKAVAWFGMETSNCAPHGLWSISLDSGLAQIRSMGFNTIRLPYSNECLAKATTTSIDASKNPSLVGKSPLQVMDAFIARAKAYNLNVILDRHRPGSDAQSPLWYTAAYSEARWIKDWKSLAKRYANRSNVIGVDLHNEPNGSACWGCGDRATDWRAAATRAGNAVLAVNPKLLIIVEGTQQAPGGTTWWGGGLAEAGAKPVNLTVKHRVVYSPHDYPASIYAQSWFAAANYPANLPGVWNANWGYLVKKNVAPVLLGEFGTKLETTSDKQWLATMVTYLKKNKISFAYWSFNPNSGDTGGIVKDDWTTAQAEKLRYLAPLLGKGTPVKVEQTTTTSTSTPSTAPSTAPTTAPTTTATTSTTAPWTTAASTASADGLSASWRLQSAWGEGYVAQLDVSSDAAASSWTVTWPDSAATSVANAWGMTCSITPGVSVTCRGADWAKSIAAGQKVSVGLQVSSSKAPASPVITVGP